MRATTADCNSSMKSCSNRTSPLAYHSLICNAVASPSGITRLAWPSAGLCQAPGSLSVDHTNRKVGDLLTELYRIDSISLRIKQVTVHRPSG